MTLITTTIESPVSTNTSKLIFFLKKTGASQLEQKHISHIFRIILENCESHMLQPAVKPPLQYKQIIPIKMQNLPSIKQLGFSQNGSNRSLPTDDVPSTAATLPFCTATVICCSRWWPERASPISSCMCRPSSDRKEHASSPKTPEVSTATGMK